MFERFTSLIESKMLHIFRRSSVQFDDHAAVILTRLFEKRKEEREDEVEEEIEDDDNLE